MMRLRGSLAVVALTVIAAPAGAVVMSFGGLSNGTLTSGATPYIEGGFELSTPGGLSIFDNSGVSPANGPMVRPTSAQAVMTLEEVGGQPFGFAGYTYAAGTKNATLTITGTKYGGGTVTASHIWTGSLVPSVKPLNWTLDQGILLTKVEFTFGSVSAGLLDDLILEAYPVPEPASWMVLGLGLAGAGRLRRKRSN